MTRQAGRRFVLLDRDGTVIADKHYLSDPAGVELLPGAAEGLRRLADLGLGLVLVSNQSGVGRGYFSEDAMRAVNARLGALLADHSIFLDGIYSCPHTPEADCDCRKPRPGLALQAAVELGFDPKAGFMVGDKACDIELGRQVGAVTILVRTGKGAREEGNPGLDPDHVADDLRGVAEIIANYL
jgi:D-glycero-D-manno-heptose 1,7-bisphosphate phosphatase